MIDDKNSYLLKLLVILSISWLVMFSEIIGLANIINIADKFDIDGYGIYSYVGVPYAIFVIFLSSYMYRGFDLIGLSISVKEYFVYPLLGVSMICLSIALMFLLYMPVTAIDHPLSQRLFNFESDGLINRNYSIASSIMLILEASVFFPIMEELVFRGIILCTLIRYKIANSLVSSVISSLLFASIHSDVITSFIFGMLLCAIVIKTKSLKPAILMHMSYNTIVTLIEWWDPHFPVYIAYLPLDFYLWDVVLDVLVVPKWWGLANLLISTLSFLWLFLYYIPKSRRSAS